MNGAAIMASLAAAAVTAIGVHAARRRDAQVRRAAPTVMAFAAGVLVTAALVHLLPHAFRAGAAAPFWALGGFAATVLFEHFAHQHGLEGCDHAREPPSWLPLVGIGLHSFLDGPTYTIAFSAGSVSGTTVALGMVLHELPEGVIAYTLLSRGGSSPKRAAVIAWLVAGLTTPLGAIVTAPVIGTLEEGVLPLLVGLAGGVLLHVGAAHLLPQVERQRPRFALVAFALGAAIALAGALAGHG